MAFLHDDVLDGGLDVLTADADKLVLCSQAPTSFAEANATYKLAEKASPTVGAAEDRAGGGRKVVVAAITDGSVTATGTATHWALLDTANSKLLAWQTVTSQALTNGNTFQLNALNIGIPDPA
ncbi:MAG: hypothetical protein KDD83_15075 [Caldilineaceae bacterium]|nr:hypothetical protein [Caldilineaceae bacterium]